MKLTDAKNIKEILKKYETTFKKSLGQNFLIDDNILSLIADEGADADAVLEIGPGIGVLTKELAKRTKKLVTVEIDKTLIPILNETLADFQNIKIINEDILKVDLESLFKEEFSGMSVSVCANLPYYITTPIIMKLLESKMPLKSMVFMVQKEVAERLCADAGTKNYGAISVSVKYFGEAKVIKTVPPHSFIPQPDVTSSVVKISLYESKKYNPQNEKLFRDLIRAAFSQRRKTFVNAVSNSLGYGISKALLLEILTELGFNESIRGETLNIDEFIVISDKIHKKLLTK